MEMGNFELKPGTLLADRYLLKEHLGRGGMGTVWLANDTHLDDLPVATKILLPELANDSQFITSLKEEAKNSMELSHQNIVRVFNFHRDEKDGQVSFLVLKYIEGRTMKEVLQEWPQGVSLERALRWAEQLASALDYAHKIDVIHRDIKPSNIMIEKDTDSALLMDFGVSRQRDQTLRIDPESSGTSFGTPAYMSPQQLHDKDCISNDIYSLAATLYEALSGRPPFIGTGIEEKILRANPEPIEGISNIVNRALLAGLAKSEEDRPENAADLIDLMMLSSGSITTDKTASDTSRFTPIASEVATPAISDPTLPQASAGTPNSNSIKQVERNHLVLLGCPHSGKTVFLASLYDAFWNRARPIQIEAIDGRTHKAMTENIKALRSGTWPSSTKEIKHLDLVVTVDGKSRPLVSVDYPGDLFRDAFIDESKTKDVQEFLDHIDRAAAVLVLVDPRAVVNATSTVSMDDNYGMVKAIERIRACPGGEDIPIAVVLTKYDKCRSQVSHCGGAVRFVKKHYPSLVRSVSRASVFTCSIVDVKRNTKAGSESSQIFNSKGTAAPIQWILNQLHEIDIEQDAAKRTARSKKALDDAEQLEQRRKERNSRYWIVGWVLFIVIFFIIGFITYITVWSDLHHSWTEAQ